MYRNRRILSMVVCVITSMIFLGGVCTAAKDLSEYIEEFKYKTDCDVQVVGMSSAGLRLDMSFMFFDKNGLPINFSDVRMTIDVVTVERGGYYSSGPVIRLARIFSIDGEVWGEPELRDEKVDVEYKDILVPIKRDDGVIELREMRAQEAKMSLKIRDFFNARENNITTRRGDDQVAIFITVYKPDENYSRYLAYEFLNVE